MADDDPLVRVATLHDLVQADLVKALLETNEIPVVVPGAQFRASQGGFLAAFIELPVMVPQSYAARAEELIRSLDEGVPIEGEGGWPIVAEPETAPRVEPDAKAKKPDSPRFRRIAAFCSLAVTFGTGHFYAREHVSGLVLLCAEVCAIWAGFSGEVGAAVAWPLIVAIDFFGSIAAVGRHRAGRPWPPLAQLIVTGFFVVLAFLIGLVGVPYLQARFDPVPPSGYLDLHEPPEAPLDP